MDDSLAILIRRHERTIKVQQAEVARLERQLVRELFWLGQVESEIRINAALLEAERDRPAGPP